MSDSTTPSPPPVAPEQKQPVKINILEFASDVREALQKHGETEMALMAQDCIMKMAGALQNANGRAAQLKSSCDALVQIIDRSEKALYQTPPDVAKARLILAAVTKAGEPAKSTLKLVTGPGSPS